MVERAPAHRSTQRACRLGASSCVSEPVPASAALPAAGRAAEGVITIADDDKDADIDDGSRYGVGPGSRRSPVPPIGSICSAVRAATRVPRAGRY